MDYSTPGFPVLHISWSLLKLMSIKSVIPSNYLIFCCSLLLLPLVFLSIRIFSNELALHIRWPKYWSFNFSISPSTEYSGLISFGIDWFHFLAVQGTLKSLLQHHSSKASVLQHSVLLLSSSHICTWLLEKKKTVALTIWNFVSKSLLFNMLLRFAIAFLPRNRHLSISWLQLLSAVIL